MEMVRGTVPTALDRQDRVKFRNCKTLIMKLCTWSCSLTSRHAGNFCFHKKVLQSHTVPLYTIHSTYLQGKLVPKNTKGGILSSKDFKVSVLNVLERDESSQLYSWAQFTEEKPEAQSYKRRITRHTTISSWIRNRSRFSHFYFPH